MPVEAKAGMRMSDTGLGTRETAAVLGGDADRGRSYGLAVGDGVLEMFSVILPMHSVHASVAG